MIRTIHSCFEFGSFNRSFIPPDKKKESQYAQIEKELLVLGIKFPWCQKLAHTISYT